LPARSHKAACGVCGVGFSLLEVEVRQVFGDDVVQVAAGGQTLD
jgi:hypothetical protein